MIKIFDHDEEDDNKEFWVPTADLEKVADVDVPDEEIISPEEIEQLTQDKRREEADDRDRDIANGDL